MTVMQFKMSHESLFAPLTHLQFLLLTTIVIAVALFSRKNQYFSLGSRDSGEPPLLRAWEDCKEREKITLRLQLITMKLLCKDQE